MFWYGSEIVKKNFDEHEEDDFVQSRKGKAMRDGLLSLLDVCFGMKTVTLSQPLCKLGAQQRAERSEEMKDKACENELLKTNLLKYSI